MNTTSRPSYIVVIILLGICGSIVGCGWLLQIMFGR